ncbi:MAG: hypothetical protein KAR00_03080 [Candidatus Pacebacteria bacterium]|nr:hypothetical protein [Candidatus Paceibacterota bacterium]
MENKLNEIHNEVKGLVTQIENVVTAAQNEFSEIRKTMATKEDLRDLKDYFETNFTNQFDGLRDDMRKVKTEIGIE